MYIQVYIYMYLHIHIYIYVQYDAHKCTQQALQPLLHGGSALGWLQPLGSLGWPRRTEPTSKRVPVFTSLNPPLATPSALLQVLDMKPHVEITGSLQQRWFW